MPEKDLGEISYVPLTKNEAADLMKSSVDAEEFKEKAVIKMILKADVISGGSASEEDFGKLSYATFERLKSALTARLPKFVKQS